MWPSGALGLALFYILWCTKWACGTVCGSFECSFRWFSRDMKAKNANFVECNASDADFNSHSMPSLVSLSSSSYSSDSALSPSSSASQSSALRSLSPSSAFRFHQSHCDSNALGYHMLWVAGGNCVTASAVTATAECYVNLLYFTYLLIYLPDAKRCFDSK